MTIPALHYPHIVERVLCDAALDGAHHVRLLSRATKDLVDAVLCAHILVALDREDATDDDQAAADDGRGFLPNDDVPPWVTRAQLDKRERARVQGIYRRQHHGRLLRVPGLNWASARAETIRLIAAHTTLVDTYAIDNPMWDGLPLPHPTDRALVRALAAVPCRGPAHTWLATPNATLWGNPYHGYHEHRYAVWGQRLCPDTRALVAHLSFAHERLAADLNARLMGCEFEPPDPHLVRILLAKSGRTSLEQVTVHLDWTGIKDDGGQGLLDGLADVIALHSDLRWTIVGVGDEGTEEFEVTKRVESGDSPAKRLREAVRLGVVERWPERVDTAGDELDARLRVFTTEEYRRSVGERAYAAEHSAWLGAGLTCRDFEPVKYAQCTCDACRPPEKYW
ncbi:uncharacterized protein LOC62_07G008832 [Vanrija pseudolonga]|uniref:Uncharacterized protein n=1 Tax=Vanrija pseudolonga TaxID=143232 RepID=A0AAF1BLQ7_9TREE|nr:hypothetical protein LOC62_07G008832 [Vanrija pseudolonga]